MLNRLFERGSSKYCGGHNRLTKVIQSAIQKIALATFVVTATGLSSVGAEIAILSNPVVSDVTDRSFSLIWTTDRAGEFTLELYSNQAGTQQVNGFNISNYGIKTASSLFPTSVDTLNKTAIVSALETKGIVKVVVSGLPENTTYYIKYGVVDNATSEVTNCPDSGPAYCLDSATELLTVHTEKKVIRELSASELLLNDVILHIDATAQQGEIILISTEASSYPTSAIIGDVVPAPYALIDLNNYFDAVSNESVQMHSVVETGQGNPNKALNIVHYGGVNGLSNQLAILDATTGTGNIAGASNRAIGDCNADGNTNGYDNLLLANYLAGVFTSQNDEDVSFHKFLCNLALESDLNYIDADVVINAQDFLLHNELLVGRQDASTLPVVP